MTRVIVADAETRSACDLTKRGAHVYGEDPSTRVLCVAFTDASDPRREEMWIARPVAVDPVMAGVPLVDPRRFPFPVYFDRDVPPLAREIAARAAEPGAHNAPFEIAVWPILVRRYGFPEIDPARWVCTMARAALSGIPGKLEHACAALNLSHRKDMAGHRAMMKLCKPRGPRKGEDPTRVYWHDDPDDHMTNYLYAMQDARAEAELYRRLPAPPPQEAAVMRVDREINMRGIRVDVEAAQGAQAIAAKELSRLDREMKKLTNEQVGTVNQRDKIMGWCAGQGVHLENLRANTVRDLLSDDEDDPGVAFDVIDGAIAQVSATMPEHVRAVLAVRAEAAKASAKKLKSMCNRASADGRVRGALAYHAAYRTGRWAGRGVQPHNDPRMNPPEDVPEEVWFDALSTGDRDYFASFLPGPTDDAPGWTVMDGLKASIRGMKLPAPGKVYVAPDLAQIEARALAWAAGQTDKIEAFRHLDRLKATKAPKDAIAAADIYTVTGRKMNMGRQEGKIAELSCFAADTPVLVKLPSGVITAVPITCVSSAYKVWDGIEWVSTLGPTHRGRRMTERFLTVWATPDHALLCGAKWSPIGSALRSASIRSRALATASESLRSAGMSWVCAEVSRLRSASARAGDLRTKSPLAICAPGAVRAARAAAGWPLARLRAGLKSVTPATPASSKTTRTGADCSTGSTPRKTGARTRGPKRILRTGAAVSGSTRSGGVQTVARAFSGICSRLRGGKFQTTRSTELTTTGATSPAIYGLFPAIVTRGTGAASRRCRSASSILRRKCDVFDLVNCGPRNRFTILTAGGPVIVHNCGYNAGAHTFQLFALGYGAKFSIEEAETIVQAWRKANPMIVLLWRAEDDAAKAAIENPGVVIDRGALGGYRFDPQTGNLVRKLPCGYRFIVYRKARIEMKLAPWGQNRRVITYEGNTYAKNSDTFVRLSTYGGKLVENLIQAMCRDILAEGLVRIAHNYLLPIVFHVHDEGVGEVREERAEDAAVAMVAGLTEVPVWAPGLPISSSADILPRYRKT